MNGIARELKRVTHNSTHLITPFDNGGSSRALRDAFDMPALGDLRSRLMALANEDTPDQRAVYRLFKHRLPEVATPATLHNTLSTLVDGTHNLIHDIKGPIKSQIILLLQEFLQTAPNGFDYRGASIGNLILAGSYFRNGRQLETALDDMAQMVGLLGTVKPIADVNMHLAVALADGQMIFGQRHFTGKFAPAITAPIRRMFITDGRHEVSSTKIAMSDAHRDRIEQADLICFPPGSLYSSIIANLLPAGVGRAVAASRARKVYLPSLGSDPETPGMTLCDQIDALLSPMISDTASSHAARQFITDLVCDLSVPQTTCDEVTQRFGITCHRVPLISANPNRYNPRAVSAKLMDLSAPAGHLSPLENGHTHMPLRPAE